MHRERARCADELRPNSIRRVVSRLTEARWAENLSSSARISSAECEGRRRRLDIPTLLKGENTVAWNLYETGQEGARWLDSGGEDTLARLVCSVALWSEFEMPEQELTRRAMYDLVWYRPMTKVAEDLGISDVGLKKICDKHRVPTPPRGYWAKRDAGKPTKQIQFHSTADPQHEHIVIHGSHNNLAPEVREVLEQAPITNAKRRWERNDAYDQANRFVRFGATAWSFPARYGVAQKL